jgi:hypothetical protein
MYSFLQAMIKSLTAGIAGKTTRSTGIKKSILSGKSGSSGGVPGGNAVDHGRVATNLQAAP